MNPSNIIKSNQLTYSFASAIFYSDGKKTTRLMLNGEGEHNTKIRAKTSLIGLTLFFERLSSKVLGTEKKWIKVNIENTIPSTLNRFKNLCYKIVHFILTLKWIEITDNPNTQTILLNINSLCKRTTLSKKEIVEKSTEELSNLLANPMSITWNYSQLDNDLFPHILFIHMKDREDRLKSFKEHLTIIGANLKYTQVDAVIGNDLSFEEINKMSKSNYAKKTGKDDRKGRLGCFMSQLKALKLAKKNGWSEVLIIEDDARFIPNYFSGNFVRKARQELPKDWGILFLGYLETDKSKIKPFSDHLLHPGCPYDTHAYLVNSSIYDDLINVIEAEFEKCSGEMRAFDVVIGEETPKTGKVFCCKENIVIQDEGYSSILGKKTAGNYSKELKKFKSILSPRQSNATKTADGFPIMPPLLAGTLYQMTFHIDRIFNKYGIQYFVESGTALGAERHLGLIPHDDDVDIQIFPENEKKLQDENFKNELRSVGLEIVPHWLGAKICPIKDHPLGYSHDMDGYQFKTPNVDIFFSQEEIRDGESVHFYKSDRCRKLWPHMFIKKSEIFQSDGNMRRVSFGPITVNAIARQKDYCFRCYGENCFREAYQQYDHLRERGLEKKPVLLTDFAPPTFKQWDGIEKIPEAMDQ